MRRLSMIAVLAMQLAAACAREPKPADDKARSLPPCPDIAAMVNGRPVTTKQLRLFAEVAVRNDPRTGEHRADLYQNSLNDLVRRELLYQEAETRRVVAPPAALEAAEKEARASFSNEPALLAFLAEQGLGLESFREELRIQEHARLVMAQEAESRVPLATAAEGEQFYKMYNPGAKKPSAEEIESWRWQVTRNKRGMAVRELLDSLNAKAKIERYVRPGECQVGPPPRSQ